MADGRYKLVFLHDNICNGFYIISICFAVLDGSYREPPAEKREDYIRFYRTQAENFVAAARQIPER